MEVIKGYVYFKHFGVECKVGKSNYPPKVVAIRNLVDKKDAYKLVLGHFQANYDSDKYHLPEQEIKKMTSPLYIICNKHGPYKSTPSRIVAKIGCRLCKMESLHETLRSTKEDFIKKARAIHGDFYDYSKVEYVNSFTHVNITCPYHGVFRQTPSTHLHGKRCGCPVCGQIQRTASVKRYANSFGYSENQREHYKKVCAEGTYLYLMRMSGFGETFYKVGLSKQLDIRTYNIEYDSGYKVEVLTKKFFEDAGLAYDAEQEIIKSSVRYYPKRYFRGITEAIREVVDNKKHLPD